MKIFMLDLWSDLREKRLWLVAVVLLLGLVAVPVILAKPAEEPSAPPAVKAPSHGDQAKIVNRPSCDATSATAPR